MQATNGDGSRVAEDAAQGGDDAGGGDADAGTPPNKVHDDDVSLATLALSPVHHRMVDESHRNDEQGPGVWNATFEEDAILDDSELIGEPGAHKMRDAFVVIIGVGGVGSHAADILARSGVRRLRLVDPAMATPRSLRTSALLSAGDIGAPIAASCAVRLRAVCPALDVSTLECRVSRTEGADLALSDAPDHVLDCTGGTDIDAKVAVIEACRAANVSCTSAMGAAGKTDPGKVRVADISETLVDTMCRRVRRRLAVRGIHDGVGVVYSVEREVKDGSRARRGDGGEASLSMTAESLGLSGPGRPGGAAAACPLFAPHASLFGGAMASCAIHAIAASASSAVSAGGCAGAAATGSSMVASDRAAQGDTSNHQPAPGASPQRHQPQPQIDWGAAGAAANAAANAADDRGIGQRERHHPRPGSIGASGAPRGREALYRRLWSSLLRREPDSVAGLSPAIVGRVVEDAWRGRCAATGTLHRLRFVTWDTSSPCSLDNAVLLCAAEARVHEDRSGPSDAPERLRERVERGLAAARQVLMQETRMLPSNPESKT